MSSLKIMVFPGPEGVAYTTEKKKVQSNPMVEFLSDRSSVTQEQIYTMKQLSNREHDGNKRRDGNNKRDLVCPPILDLSMTKQRYEMHQVHKPRRIFNGFFPSRIRTTSNSLGFTKETKEKQDPFDELVPDPNTPPFQNGAAQGSQNGSRHSQRSEPTNWRTRCQQAAQEEASHRDRHVVYSLRNGSPSPWINRYQLKKNHISASHKGDRDSRKRQSTPFDNISRGLSR